VHEGGGMYLWLKLIHVVGVVAFLGNFVTGLFWHVHASRTRDPKILAHQLARQWELWGAVALLTPLAGRVLMVLKP